MKYFLQKIHVFYYQYPLSQYALAQISGILFGINNIFGILLLLSLLMTTKPKNIFFLIIFFLLPLPIMQNFYKFPEKNSYIQGQGLFIPYSQVLTTDHLWRVQGKLVYFIDSSTNDKYKNITCFTYSHQNLSLFGNYKVLGQLIHKNINYCFLKSSIELIKNKKDLKSIGLFLNTKLSSYIDNHFKKIEEQHFLKALFLGHPLPYEIKQHFQKLGISHMLIISGFHFGFILLIFSIIFSCFSYRIRFFLLLITVTGFMIMLCPSPSIVRAWITCSLAIIATIFSRSCAGITKLSVSSLVILTTNPLNLLNLSFQFSFLATLGILMFYPFIKENICILFDKQKMSTKKNVLPTIINALIDYLSITIAAQIFIIPLLIFHFHKFYLGIFFYNILFSPLIQLTLILFVSCFFLPFKFLFSFTALYINWLLHLTAHPPLLFKNIWITSKIPIYCIFIYFIVTFHIGVLLFLKKRKYQGNKYMD